MLSACRIEEIEAPSIKEQEKHYVPNVFLLLKKIKYETQQRVQAVRSKRRCPCKIVTVHHYQNKTLLMIESNKRIDEEDCESAPFIGFNDQEAGTDEIKKDEKTLLVMDQAAIFENFLKRYNLNKVASDYERFCLRKGYQHRPKGSTLNPKRRMTLKGPLPARGSHEALSGK